MRESFRKENVEFPISNERKNLSLCCYSLTDPKLFVPIPGSGLGSGSGLKKNSLVSDPDPSLILSL